MIVGSVLLVIGAGVLLGLGLVLLDEPLLYSSIGMSVMAALTLVVGLRRHAAVRAGRGTIAVRPVVAAGEPEGEPAEDSASESSQGTGPVGRATPRPVGRATPRPVGRAKVSSLVDGGAPVDLEALADADPTVPSDEPAAEPVTEADLARLGGLDTEVVVVDGRPRFHLAGCVHLLGLEAEALSAAEAVELGFTPCGGCRAASDLLTDVDDDAGRSTA